jgi:hypothetical protein
MNRSLVPRVDVAFSDPACADLRERFEHATTDEERIAVIRRRAAELGAIIGTSRYWCDGWWADAIAPGFGTVAEAESELEAAVLVFARLVEHRISDRCPQDWKVR